MIAILSTSTDLRPISDSSTNLSTVNSVKSNKNSLESLHSSASVKLLFEQITTLKSENLRLMNEVIESQRSLQTLLKQILDEQRNQMQLLQGSLDHLHIMSDVSRRDTSG